MSDEDSDFYADITRRKAWFFECQLRNLNLDAFRVVNEHGKILGTKADPQHPALLELISEIDPGAPLGTRAKTGTRVYLDGQEPRRPVWTDEQRAQHDAFAASLTGRMSDFLHQTPPIRLAAALAELKAGFEAGPFGSRFDPPSQLSAYPRKAASEDGGELAHAISRMSIVQIRPWLIPELFEFNPKDPSKVSSALEDFIDNAHLFIACVETEIRLVSGANLDDKNATAGTSEADPERLEKLWAGWHAADPSAAVQVKFWDKPGEKYLVNFQIKTKDKDFVPVAELPFAHLLNYWLGCFRNPVLEVYVNKADSDMGLCQLMRALYLFGTLPDNLGRDEDILKWRPRPAADHDFEGFFGSLARDLPEASPLRAELTDVKARLAALIEQSKRAPRSAALGFSPLGQEILKRAILQYKFWLDEPFRALVGDAEDEDKNGINQMRSDFGIGDPFVEMEYWSENHYLMFCSSEYLAGQLWENESFLPAKDAPPAGFDPTQGKLSGAKRKERGKARALKWLNNKLLFGWTEFNAHGYYREHLVALMNLVDFALDKELRDKATLVMDLLLFDIMRFSQGGSMGAAGGRSQFKSKMGGRDNAGSDAIEIWLGKRGIFLDRGSKTGCSVATCTYRVPAVLLEIGRHPPLRGSTDRSRVSVGFDDAPKHGIIYSQESSQKTSLMDGFAPKRTKHFSALQRINGLITLHHTDYGQAEDDTVFWWGMSAYFNKQVVRNTFDCVDKYGLGKVRAFASFVSSLVDFWLPLVEKLGAGRLGANLSSTVIGGVPGGVLAFFANKALGIDLEENASDDVSIFIEGSTRTRANLMTYRSRDFVLSSVQNFRAGQFNFQSSINQLSLSTDVNVFSTAAFPGIEMSALESGFWGGLAGAAVGVFAFPAAGVVALGAGVIGTAAAIIGSETQRHTNPFGDDEDGPGWWTGYWALPRVVQHGSAAILAYDFSYLQSEMTRAGSHVWFPKYAFDAVEERRCAAYEDANSPVLDMFEPGPKGFWLFGKIVQPADPNDPNDIPETYVGVFSNQRPEWLDQDHYFYENKLHERNVAALKAIQATFDEALDALVKEDKADRRTLRDAVVAAVQRTISLYIPTADWLSLAIKELTRPGSPVASNDMEKLKALAGAFMQQIYHQTIWAKDLSHELFADKDWYVGGKNIWIHQVGSKAEFGSFDRFKDLVSKAKVEVDDAGNLGCTYHVPKPDGSSEALALDGANGGRFALNGKPLETDYYPRFENEFVRGGLVEWGQREYVIEYRGKALMHDFSVLEQPDRSETPGLKAEDPNTLKALVIYIATGDEEMELTSVALATVKSGCEVLVTHEIVAAGAVKANTTHDAEWIFLDRPGLLTPDMTLDIMHPRTRRGNDDPKWKMGFELKALLGDRRLYDCSPSFAGCHFEDARRSTGPIPFSIRVSRWQRWEAIDDLGRFATWQVAAQPAWDFFYYDYCDLLAVTAAGQLWHRRSATCPTSASAWEVVGGMGPTPSFGAASELCGITTQPGNLFLFTIHSGELLYCAALSGEDLTDKHWTKAEAHTIQATPFGIPIMGLPPVPIPLSSGSQVVARPLPDGQAAVALYLLGVDDNFYSRASWMPGDKEPWRVIATAAVFKPLAGAAFEVCGDHLFALDDRRQLWVGALDDSRSPLTPDWKRVSGEEVEIDHFSVANRGSVFMLLISANQGEIWAAGFSPVDLGATWERLGSPDDFMATPNAKVLCATPSDGQLEVFVNGADGKIHKATWYAAGGWITARTWQELSDEGRSFDGAVHEPIALLNRVKNQLEVLTRGQDERLWKTWWS